MTKKFHVQRPRPTKEKRITLRINTSQLDAVMLAAGYADMGVSEWVRRALVRMADVELQGLIANPNPNIGND